MKFSVVVKTGWFETKTKIKLPGFATKTKNKTKVQDQYKTARFKTI